MNISVAVGEKEYRSATRERQVDIDAWSAYYVLLHDQELALYHYKPRSLFDPSDGLLDRMGYPEMVPLLYRYALPLTEKIQWLWFALCVLAKHGHTNWKSLAPAEQKLLASQWGTLTDSKRFATNKVGTDRHANFIAHQILREPLKDGVAKQLSVLCGGNMVKAKSHTVFHLGGKDVLEIDVWDGKIIPNALHFNWSTHPHLVHWATNSTPFNYAGMWSDVGPWRVDPFPFFNGAPYIVYSSRPQFVEVARVRRLHVSELYPRPYRP